MTKFWKVVKATGNDSGGTNRYPTIQDAMKVAEWMCQKYDAEYVVLEAIGYYATPRIPAHWHVMS